MGLLRLAVLGPPEVFHDGNRLSFSFAQGAGLAALPGGRRGDASPQQTGCSPVAR